MSVKEDALKKMDREIADFFRSMDTEPDKAAVEKLQIYTLIRHELDNIPLNPPQVEALYECSSLLKMVDSTFDVHMVRDKTPDYTDLTRAFAEDVYREYRMDRLWERMSRENKEFHEKLLVLPPEKIIDSASEIAVKNDILLLVEDNSFTFQQIDALLTLEHPLHDIYEKWTDTETNYMDMLLEVLEELTAEQDGFLKNNDSLDTQTSDEVIRVFNNMYVVEGEEDFSEYENDEVEDEDLEP